VSRRWHRGGHHHHPHRHDDHHPGHDEHHGHDHDHDHDHPPFPPWRHHPWHHHRRWREGLRHYTGAHLRRRLFLWFGATIFVTVVIVGLVLRATRGDAGQGPSHPLLALGAAAFALWVLSGRLAWRIARPLDELVHVSGEIGRGNLSARAQLACGGIDEIAVLARALNEMAGRIERQIADQRELLAGVSHELRTPLARLRVLLDIARERGATAQTYDELERELLEMDRLVGELLASARLEFQALAARPLDAVELGRRALERAGLPAERLASETTAAPFAGDPTLVGRALANLLDNAVKHAGGVERLRVFTRPGFVGFEVSDRGPGLTPELLDGKFRPFVRPSGAGQGESLGLGLGLALVARIARAHGGSVQAGNRPEGGARLVLELAEKPPASAP
jgi:signal transduction histidine kinase